MSRRRRQAKRQIVDDPIYGLKSVSKFINALMIGGKKNNCGKNFLLFI
jgi:ribosomal protein S7